MDRVERIARQPPVSQPHADDPPGPGAASGRKRAVVPATGSPRAIVAAVGSELSPLRGLLQDRLGWDSTLTDAGRTDVSDRFYCPDPPQAGRFRLRPGGIPAPRPGLPRRAAGIASRSSTDADSRTVAEILAVASDCVELVAVGEPIPHAPAPRALSSSPPRCPRENGSTGSSRRPPSWELTGSSRRSPSDPSSSRAAPSSTDCAGRSSRHRNNAGGRGS